MEEPHPSFGQPNPPSEFEPRGLHATPNQGVEEPQQSFGLPNPSSEVKPRGFKDGTPNHAVEAPQPNFGLPKPPFSVHSASPHTISIPQPSFFWPTRIPHQQLPTSSSILQQFSWLTRIHHQQLLTSSSILQQLSWLNRVPSNSRQRPASFPSLVFPGQPGFATSSYQPTAAFCRSFHG